MALLGLLAGPTWADDVRRDWPAGDAISPPLWLQMTGAASAPVAQVQAWLPGSQGQRPYPPEGLALGLVAPVPDGQDQVVWQVLHPAVPLAEVRSWPARQVRRLALLPASAPVWRDDQPVAQAAWQPDHPVSLQMQLPLPADVARADWQQAVLLLPLAERPAVPPAVSLMLLPAQSVCMSPDDCLTTLLTADDASVPVPAALTADGLALDLSDWLASLPAATAGAVVSLRLRFEARQPSERGRLRDWAESPARWRLDWLMPGAVRSGEQQLRLVLDSLLQRPLTRLPEPPPPASVDAVTYLPRELPVTDIPMPASACGHPALWSPADGLTLDAWRDQALAPPAREVARQPWAHATSPDDDLAAWLQPRPGRWQWPGNLLRCPQGGSCTDGSTHDMQSALATAAANLPWLTDAGVQPGQPLQDGKTAFLGEASLDRLLAAQDMPVSSAQRDTLRQRMTDWMTTPLPAPGALTLLPALPGEAADALLWQRSDGQLLLLDEALTPQWRWLPDALAPAWLHWHEDAISRDPAPTPPAWQLAQWQDAAGRWHRQAYGLLQGRVWRLDLDDLHQPVLGWLPASAGMTVSTFTVLTASLRNAMAQPVLLLSGGGAGTPETVMLALVDGLRGDVLWRAGPQAGTGIQQADAALVAGWSAPWRGLPTASHQLLLYGLDRQAQLWRLRLDLQPESPGQMALGLQRVATLAAEGHSSRSTAMPPGVAWLRPNGAAALRPGILTLVQTADEPVEERLVLLLDQPDMPTPSPIRLEQLAEWDAVHPAPPVTALGWQRPWRHAGEMATTAPRMLRQQIHVATDAPVAETGCAPARRQAWLYRLPWQAGGSGPMSVEEAHEVPAPVTSGPVLTGSGQLRWSTSGGVIEERASEAAGSWRRRISREPLPAQ